MLGPKKITETAGLEKVTAEDTESSPRTTAEIATPRARRVEENTRVVFTRIIENDAQRHASDPVR